MWSSCKPTGDIQVRRRPGIRVTRTNGYEFELRLLKRIASSSRISGRQ